MTLTFSAVTCEVGNLGSLSGKSEIWGPDVSIYGKRLPDDVVWNQRNPLVYSVYFVRFNFPNCTEIWDPLAECQKFGDPT